MDNYCFYGSWIRRSNSKQQKHKSKNREARSEIMVLLSYVVFQFDKFTYFKYLKTIQEPSKIAFPKFQRHKSLKHTVHVCKAIFSSRLCEYSKIQTDLPITIVRHTRNFFYMHTQTLEDNFSNKLTCHCVPSDSAVIHSSLQMTLTACLNLC